MLHNVELGTCMKMSAPNAEPTALEHSELGWFTPAEMVSFDFCEADAELLPVVFEKNA